MRQGIIIDDREFQHALKQYSEYCKKDFNDIVLKVAKDVAYRAAQFTEKSTASKIKAELLSMKNPKTSALGGGSLKARPFIYLIINSVRRNSGKRGFVGSEMSKEARETIQARIRGIGYLRSGWAKAVRALGGRFSGKTVSKGNLGGGEMHKGFNPHALIYSSIPGSGQREEKALLRAVAFKINDMAAYVDRKLSQNAKKISA